MPSTAAPPQPLTWERLCTDPEFAYLQDIPGKVETNAHNQIVVSPTYFYHGLYQARLARLLKDHLADGGEAVVEAAIETTDGTKVADVAWFDAEHVAEMQGQLSADRAPAVCVEVVSAFNTAQEIAGKTSLYLAAGAREVWICDRTGRLRFFDADGERARSALAPAAPASVG